MKKEKSKPNFRPFNPSVRGHGRKEPYHGKTHRPHQSQTAEGKIISCRRIWWDRKSGRPNPSTSIQKYIQRALKAQELCRQCRGKNTPAHSRLHAFGGLMRRYRPGSHASLSPMKTSSGMVGNSICWIRPVCRKCSVSAPLQNIRWTRGNRKAVETIRKMAADPQETGLFISMGLRGGKTMLAGPVRQKKKLPPGKVVRFTTTAGL